VSSPYESGQLILKLYELRQDPALRKAREWFLRDFHPESAADVAAVLALGEREPLYRMVTDYWDMAASLATHGAIDAEMFRDANPEIVAAFAKVRPFLAELRATIGIPEYLQHVERVVLDMPRAEARLVTLREQFAEARRAAEERITDTVLSRVF
jgi:hypothetical protein